MFGASQRFTALEALEARPHLWFSRCRQFICQHVLENHASWYCESDPTWGGPPSKESLVALSDALRQAYMNIAALTGLDPCD